MSTLRPLGLEQQAFITLARSSLPKPGTKVTGSDVDFADALEAVGNRFGFMPVGIRDVSSADILSPMHPSWLHEATAQLFSDIPAFPQVMAAVTEFDKIPSPLDVITRTHVGTYRFDRPAADGAVRLFTLEGARLLAETQPEHTIVLTDRRTVGVFDPQMSNGELTEFLNTQVVFPEEFGKNPGIFKSVRTNNCLGHSATIFWGDIIGKTEDELLKIKNFGRKSLNEIKVKLAEATDDRLKLGLKIQGWERPKV